MSIRDGSLPEHVEDVGTRVVDAAFQVYSLLGPGMLESVYQQAFAIALAADGLSFQREVWMDVEFMGQTLRHAFRADFVIEKYCIVELKSVESILAVHEKQLVTYLRLARLPLGYLVSIHPYSAKA